MNNNNVRLTSIIGVVVPLACAIVLGLLCMQQRQRLQDDQKDQVAQQQTVDSLNLMKNNVDIEPLTSKKIAAINTADEQAEFLTQLRLNAQNSGVKLVQYMNMGTPAPRPDANGQLPQPSQNDFRPVASTLTVQGPYNGVRAFAYALLRSNRLMNMNGVTWKRDTEKTTTTLSFTLIRYVTEPFTSATTTVSMATPASDGGAIR